MNPVPAGRALIVDDDDSIRRMVCKLLVREGFDVDEARDGVEAIEKLKEQDYEVVVLDLMMPRIDGFGVVEYLRTEQPGMIDRIVVMTAFDDSARKRLTAGCRVLAKPFDISELMMNVRECATA
jgi:DNA-binding response OmpR family regulator